MFLRLVQTRVKPDKIFEFERVYERSIIPILQQTPGCLFAGLVQSLEEPNEGMSMTLWSHQDNALAYERSGKYAEVLDAARPFFFDSSEWRVQLSDDLRLELLPATPEPEVTSYTTEEPALEPSGLANVRARSTYLRIVSMKLNPKKKQEFVEIYHRDIIPGLRQIEGCLDAYLAEGATEDNEVLSITLWRSLQQAEAYEASGEFDKLKQKVQHTFSNLARWKIALDQVPLTGTRGMAKETVTSDDVAVKTYSIVMGKAFR